MNPATEDLRLFAKDLENNGILGRKHLHPHQDFLKEVCTAHKVLPHLVHSVIGRDRNDADTSILVWADYTHMAILEAKTFDVFLRYSTLGWDSEIVWEQDRMSGTD
jgi:hypothetical protein